MGNQCPKVDYDDENDDHTGYPGKIHAESVLPGLQQLRELRIIYHYKLRLNAWFTDLIPIGVLLGNVLKPSSCSCTRHSFPCVSAYVRI